MGRWRIGLASLVTFMWVVGYGKAYIDGLAVPSELSGLEAIVLGWALGGGIADALKRRNGKGGDDR
jgi:hypothetical protein